MKKWYGENRTNSTGDYGPVTYMHIVRDTTEIWRHTKVYPSHEVPHCFSILLTYVSASLIIPFKVYLGSVKRGAHPHPVDDDWQLAMSQGASPLHILNPTGLQLQLKQSIVKKDAYLPRSVHVRANTHTYCICI